MDKSGYAQRLVVVLSVDAYSENVDSDLWLAIAHSKISSNEARFIIANFQCQILLQAVPWDSTLRSELNNRFFGEVVKSVYLGFLLGKFLFF